MSIFQAEFTTGQVSAASGVSAASLQTWIRRGVIVGHRGEGVDKPGSPGLRRSFTFRNVIEIAVAKALTDLGLDVSTAFEASARFAHISGSKRLPGLPYPDALYTVLCVGGGRSEMLAWEPGQDFLTMARHHLLNPDAFATLVINDLFDRVVTALGYHPQAVIDEAYGRR